MVINKSISLYRKLICCCDILLALYYCEILLTLYYCDKLLTSFYCDMLLTLYYCDPLLTFKPAYFSHSPVLIRSQNKLSTERNGSTLYQPVPSFIYRTCTEFILRIERDSRQLLMAVKDGGCGVQRAGGEIKNIVRRCCVGKTWKFEGSGR